MDNTLMAYANVFSYYSDFVPTDFNNSKYYSACSQVWDDMDSSIRRLYAINKVLVPDEVITITSRNFAEDFETFTNNSLTSILNSTDQSDATKSLSDFYLTNFSDVTEIVFFKYYSHIIINLKRLGLLDRQNDLGHLFFVLQNFEEIKSFLNTNNHALSLYSNFLYGKLPRSDAEKVRRTSKAIQNSIINLKKCIYGDIDIFYLKNQNDIRLFLEKISYKLDILGLPYKFRQIDNMVIHSKKQYFIKYSDGEVKIRGFPGPNEKQLSLLGVI
jgi:hypothetical protein